MDMESEDYEVLLERQKALLKAAKSRKGQKPHASLRLSREQLDQEFTIAALQASMTTPGSPQMRSCFIGEAYPPCTRSLSDLAPIYLRDLALETHHRGRVLIVKAFSEPHHMAAVSNAVEDEFGNVEHLAIFNLLPSVLPNSVLPKGIVVAIKEPYYTRTAGGDLQVRVDHPSDLIVLKPGNKLIPLSLAPRVTEVNPSALGLKEDGNAAFAKGSWQLAIDFYSEALQAEDVADQDGLQQILYRNRAGAHLRLSHFDLTIADAMNAIIPDTDLSDAARAANIKAFYRAGKAAYGMGDFDQAKQHYDQALQLDADHKETQVELGRTRRRLAEQETGAFNFSAMAKSATLAHTILDHASFLKNAEVRPAGNRGRGLFATKAMAPGDVILVEKAFYAAHTKDDEDIILITNCNTNRISAGADALRLWGIIDKLLWNPTLATKYLDLFDGGKFKVSSKKVAVVDGKVAVDTYQVLAIAEYNGFGWSRVKTGAETKVDRASPLRASTGIWLRASYTNHSCLPNANRAFVGNMMIVRAVRPILAGHEILMGYFDPTELYDKRQKIMQGGYGFKCDCALCKAESQIKGPLVQKRASLRKEIKLFLAANRLNTTNWLFVTRGQRARAEKLLENVKATYPATLFAWLPRLDCVGIGLWVIASMLLHGPGTLLPKSLELLRDCGYFVTIQNDQQVQVDDEHAVQMPEGVHAAMHASRALKAMGKKTASAAMESLAKRIHTVHYGVEEGFGEYLK